MPSLYIHVPFCVKKCDYCAFYSLPILDRDEIRVYLNGINREAELWSEEALGGVSSLFIGGGTPTVLEPEEMERFFRALENNFVWKDNIEKTMECNPGTLNYEKMEIMKKYGINRISLGVQSFQNRILKGIGRIHNVEDVYESVKIIRSFGLDSINFGLMFGLPGQDMKDWKKTVEEAVNLRPEHLSLYGLMLEEGTVLEDKYRNNKLGKNNELPDDDLQADMYDWVLEYLLAKGYIRYEISNFSLPGYECRHNLTYWRGEDYLGLGPGAFSCLDGVRTKNVENINEYFQFADKGIKPHASSETERLTKEQRISEYVILGLRTAEGIDLNKFYNKFNIEMQDIYKEILRKYIKEKIILEENGRLRLMDSYFFISNSILKNFII
ncbi:MAG: radical SAM family heme chaperone HemW [Eubacteriales bacterium]